MKTILTLLAALFAATTVGAINERTPAAPRPQVEVGTIARVVVKQVRPVYPYAMLRLGMEGTVTLEIVVDGTGKVVDVFTLRTTNEDFAAAARQAVWQWEFIPADPSDADTRQTYRLPVHFRLNSA